MSPARQEAPWPLRSLLLLRAAVPSRRLSDALVPGGRAPSPTQTATTIIQRCATRPAQDLVMGSMSALPALERCLGMASHRGERWMLVPFSECDHSLIWWPPSVTQAPTHVGFEPDCWYWRDAGARRCSRTDRLREGKGPGQRSSSWPRASRLTVMIKPAAEAGGQPARGRGVASERRVAGTWPASGGARAEPPPSEARGAPWRRRASLGPTAFFQ